MKRTTSISAMYRAAAGLLLLAVTGGALSPLAVHGADLTIADGVAVKFGRDAGLVVRDSLQAGKQTTFTSIGDDSVLGQTGAVPGTAAAGDWGGIKFEASAA